MLTHSDVEKSGGGRPRITNMLLLCVAVATTAVLMSGVLLAGFRSHVDDLTNKLPSAVADAVTKALPLAAQMQSLDGGGSAPARSPSPPPPPPKPVDARDAPEVTVNYGQIWMSKEEVDALVKRLRGTESYLEWGSGGSTLNFAAVAVHRAISIEHNADWCLKMRDSIASDVRYSRVEYHCVPVNIGYMGWGLKGGAFEEGTYVSFRQYIDEIDRLKQKFFDFVFIDGRARVDCCIKAMAYITDGTTVALHDAWRIKEYYAEIKTYYEIVEEIPGTQGLAFLKRLPKWKNIEGNSTAATQILLDKYADKLNTTASS